MSTIRAKNHAQRVKSLPTAEEKLNELAKAIEELASTIADIERDVARLKRA